MKLSKRWNRPDNPVWRKIGNVLMLGVLPVAVVVSKFFVPEPYKSAIIELSAIIIPIIKGLTKLTLTDETKAEIKKIELSK